MTSILRPSLIVALSVAAVACGENDPLTAEEHDHIGTDGGGKGMEAAAPKGECGLDTIYAGDENCILPPDPEEGLQLHVGPADYDDPDIIGEKDAEGNYLWLMEPGDERTQCYHLITPNDEGRYYFEQKYRMRFGSHHMIIRNSTNTSTEEGWMPCSGSIVGAIGGTQQIVEDLPPGGVVPPEDEGLGRGLNPHSPIDIQLHFYNPTDKPTLREIWVNFYYKPKEEVKTNLGMLGGFTRNLNIPPGTTTTVGSECTAEQAIPPATETTPARIVTLFGHAHSHNRRYVVYHDKRDGSTEVVYDSYEASESPTFTYNTVVKNPVPDAEKRRTGAKSGLLELYPGEKIRFNCDIVNDTPYTFVGQNEVDTDEMCHLFGSYAGYGFPCFTIPASTMPPAMP